MRVAAGWGLTDLDESTVGRLYEKVRAQTLAEPQLGDRKMEYLPERLQAGDMSGPLRTALCTQLQLHFIISCPRIEQQYIPRETFFFIVQHMRAMHGRFCRYKSGRLNASKFNHSDVLRTLHASGMPDTALPNMMLLTGKLFFTV